MNDIALLSDVIHGFICIFSLSVALSEKGGSHICELNYDVSAEKVSMTQLKDPKVQSEAYTLSEFMSK